MTGIAFFMLAATAVGIPLLAGNLLGELSLLQSLIVGEVMYVVVALIPFVLGDRKLIFGIQQEPMSGKVLGMVMLSSVLMLPIVTWLNAFSMLFVKNYIVDTISSAASGSLLMSLLYIALAPAVAEEFVFRGLLYHGLRQLGVLKAALISGVMFGLIHLNANQFVYAFAIGVVLALMVEATGSIYSAMIMHFCVNARSVVIMAVSSSLSAGSTGSSALADTESSISRAQMMPVVLIYRPIAIACAIGLFFAVRTAARLCGRDHFFDLAIQGQEQSIVSEVRGSEQDVQRSTRMAREIARDVWETSEDDRKKEADLCPADSVARYASHKNAEWEEASAVRKILVFLPMLAGMVICMGAMML